MKGLMKRLGTEKGEVNGKERILTMKLGQD